MLANATSTPDNQHSQRREPQLPRTRVVAGLLLAAGAGRRMGRPKALVSFENELLVERGIRLLRDGGCRPVHVVLGAAYDDVLAAIDPSGITVVRNENWASGMGSSLRHGLESMPAEVDAVVVALVDQPRIGAEAVRRLIAATGAGTGTSTGTAVATYGGIPRNPVLLGRSVWDEVIELAVGDQGARAWLRTHPHAIHAVPCDDTGTPDDLDTPEDLNRLK
jgi:CTP:molybdopterin cytidylyltransferase MocA